jgi:single-strand DNA-binding protein
MAGYNRVIVLGNLTEDPEVVPYGTGGDKELVKIVLAISRKYQKHDGSWQEATDYVPVTFFGKTGATVVDYCQKGSPLLVEARLSSRERESKSNGSKWLNLDLVGEQVTLFPKPGSGRRQKAVVEEEPAPEWGDVPF